MIYVNLGQQVSIEKPSKGKEAPNKTHHKVWCVFKSLHWFVIETHSSKFSNIAISWELKYVPQKYQCLFITILRGKISCVTWAYCALKCLVWKGPYLQRRNDFLINLFCKLSFVLDLCQIVSLAFWPFHEWMEKSFFERERESEEALIWHLIFVKV